MSSSVAYLTMYVAPSEVFVAVEVNQLIAAGIDVSLMCLRSKRPRHEQLVIEQNLQHVPIYYFPFFFSWKLWGDTLYWLRSHPGILLHMLTLITLTCWKRPVVWFKSVSILPKSFSVARVVEAEQIPIVHAAWGHYPSVTAYLIKRLIPSTQLTIALNAHDRLTRHPISAVALKQARYLFAQSEAAAHLLTNEWPRVNTEIALIRRGINIEAAENVRGVEKKQRGLIVTSGRLVKEKGHQHIIRALVLVKETFPNAQLEIFGEGPYRPKLEKLIAELGLTDSVKLPGHLSHPKLFRRVSQAGVFVLATEADYDILPNAIKEAMALGIPVVTTPSTGVTELVVEGETGFIVPTGDYQAIAQRILQIFGNAELSNCLGQAAIKHVEQYFDVKQTTLQRQQIYMQLLAETVTKKTA